VEVPGVVAAGAGRGRRGSWAGYRVGGHGDEGTAMMWIFEIGISDFGAWDA